MILLHGTTRLRAEQILQLGPDPRFREPGGQAWDDGFSKNLEGGPFHFGSVGEYARGKASEFPDQGGPVILAVDIPDNIIQKALNEWFPRNHDRLSVNSNTLLRFVYGPSVLSPKALKLKQDIAKKNAEAKAA